MGLLLEHSNGGGKTEPGSGCSFWGIKWLILVGLAVGAFFIKDGAFGTVWMYFGLIGGFLFILIQLVLIVDFFHGISDWFHDRAEKAESERGWQIGMLLLCLAVYAVALAALVLMFLYYAPDGCGGNKAILSINLIACVAASVISVLPPVQERLPNSGLLQSAFCTLYVMYITWSGFVNNPNAACNPSLAHIFDHHNASAATTPTPSPVPYPPLVLVSS